MAAGLVWTLLVSSVDQIPLMEENIKALVDSLLDMQILSFTAMGVKRLLWSGKQRAKTKWPPRCLVTPSNGLELLVMSLDSRLEGV